MPRSFSHLLWGALLFAAGVKWGHNGAILPHRSMELMMEGPPIPDTKPQTHPQWCPLAQCNSTALCQPCQRRFLIIITSPRSASTTLTWMLGAMPGIAMAGENNNALHHIKTMQDTIAKHKMMKKGASLAREDKSDLSRHGAWSHHDFVPQSFACVSQQMIRFLNPPLLTENGQEFINPLEEAREIVAFKTIRFFDEIQTPQQETQWIDWFLQHFPCARVLVNINSDIDQEARSVHQHFRDYHGVSIQGKTIDEIQPILLQKLDQMKNLVKVLGPQRAYLLDKKEWTDPDNNLTALNAAVQWLGFDPSCRFEELLEYNTKGPLGAGNKVDVPPWPKTCRAL